jgi:hypothetical protein
MRYRSAATLAATLLACAGPGDAPAPTCDDARIIATLPPELHEASGIALSRRQPGVFWIHNDSRREPLLYAVDTAGRLLATARLRTSPAPDWEDLAGGPCPAGYCLYVGDIGDNLHEREDRAILRLAEPDPATRRIDEVERFPFRYPEGPRDAEAVFVLPDTTVYIISKGRSGPVTVYRYPPPLRAAERVTLERVQQLSAGLEQVPDLVTGAAASPDGRRVAVRTYTHLQLYSPAGDTLAPLLPGRGQWLGGLQEPQGEGVALADDGTVFLVSESGPSRAPAPFSRLRCPD